MCRNGLIIGPAPLSSHLMRPVGADHVQLSGSTNLAERSSQCMIIFEVIPDKGCGGGVQAVAREWAAGSTAGPIPVSTRPPSSNHQGEAVP